MGPGGRAGLDVLADPDAVADRVAALVGEYLSEPGAPVLGLATGATFEPLYRRLGLSCRAGDLSFARATCFNLDEYVGIGPGEPGSFRAAMRRALFDHVDVRPERMHIPDGTAPDLAREAARYEAAIVAAGGIGLQLLGIGRNGHVGFNEPGSSPTSRTREVRLSDSTREANRPAFPAGAVPERAITMGLGTILEARRLVLVATGGAKRAALTAALGGPISPDCPASALRRHPGLHVVADREAAPLARAA